MPVPVQTDDHQRDAASSQDMVYLRRRSVGRGGQGLGKQRQAVIDRGKRWRVLVPFREERALLRRRVFIGHEEFRGRGIVQWRQRPSRQGSANWYHDLSFNTEAERCSRIPKCLLRGRGVIIEDLDGRCDGPKRRGSLWNGLGSQAV